MRYLEGVKGYKLWCFKKNLRRIIICRDVSFNGEIFSFKKSGNPNKGECSRPQVKVELDTERSVDAEVGQNGDPDTGSQ